MLLDDLIELGARFIPGIKEVPDRAQAAHAALDHIAQMKGEKPWLLVYDNVAQPGEHGEVDAGRRGACADHDAVVGLGARPRRW